MKCKQYSQWRGRESLLRVGLGFREYTNTICSNLKTSF